MDLLQTPFKLFKLLLIGDKLCLRCFKGFFQPFCPLVLLPLLNLGGGKLLYKPGKLCLMAEKLLPSAKKPFPFLTCPGKPVSFGSHHRKLPLHPLDGGKKLLPFHFLFIALFRQQGGIRLIFLNCLIYLFPISTLPEPLTQSLNFRFCLLRLLLSFGGGLKDWDKALPLLLFFRKLPFPALIQSDPFQLSGTAGYFAIQILYSVFHSLKTLPSVLGQL